MKERIKTVAYLLPAGVILALFVVWPTVYTVYLSFFKWNMVAPKKTFVGLGNYVDMFSDPVTWKVWGNTIIYIIVLLVFNAIVAYVLAYVLTFLVTKFRELFKSLAFLPSFISMVVGAIIYTWLLNPTSGPVAKLASMVGLQIPNWSQTNGLVILVICYVTAWKVLGYNTIMLFAAMSGVDKEVLENARLEGIGHWRTFKDIVVPMTGSTGAYVVIMTLVTGLQYVYTPIQVMTQGGPFYGSSNVIYQSYQEAFVVFRAGTSAAFSVVTLLLFIILLVLEVRFVERGVHYEH